MRRGEVAAAVLPALVVFFGLAQAPPPGANQSQAAPTANGDAQAKLEEGNAALEAGRLDDAIACYLKAKKMVPDLWRARLQLVQAYAEAGKTKERDEQRAEIRKLRAGGEYAELTRMSGYVIDKFTAGEKKVSVVEFFRPVGRNNLYYQFTVLDARGELESTIALESDDLDQSMWAKRHPELAAKGERMFSLDGYGERSHTTYELFDGRPDYDKLRTHVTDILTGKRRGLSTSGTEPAAQ